MIHRVCPVWLGYWLASPLRKLMQNPESILGPYITPGMKILEIGPAMGFFSLPMARMAGRNGQVICVDIQEKMLVGLNKRALKAGVADKIVTRVCSPDSLGVEDMAGAFDFALAFAVVHEVPDSVKLFSNIAAALKTGARCLVAEPKGHVSESEFAQKIALAERAGLRVIERPIISRSHSALLQKSPALHNA
jgi:2-polyprenyl-3-methyl-5-hydroxy-6-metoxy-1,4-benzoquinol methylase